MAINIHCTVCKNDLTLTAKKCTKCGSKIPKSRTYRVTVGRGKSRVTECTDNLSLAREIEVKLKHDMARGEFHVPKRKRITLKDLWDEYIKWAKQNKERSWYIDQCFYNKHLKAPFGDRHLNDISQLDVERLIQNLRSGNNEGKKVYKAGTIRHILNLLSHLYTLAERWGLYRGKNPCRLIHKPKVFLGVINLTRNGHVKVYHRVSL